MSANHIDLLKLEELMRYPEFNRLMAMKAGQWVAEEKKEAIEEYRQKRKQFQEDAAFELRLPDEEKGMVYYPPLYRFDLTRYGENKWKVSDLDPLPPNHIPYFALIPMEMARALAELCRGQLDTLHQLVIEYPEAWNKTVCFQVVMMSPNHVTGAMREVLDPLLYEILNKHGGPSKTELAILAKKFPYQVAMYCLDRFEEMQEPFYQAFQENLLRELVDIEDEAAEKAAKIMEKKKKKSMKNTKSKKKNPKKRKKK